jgi:hypothetical protein
MLDEVRLPHGVMEGNGAYNKHAKSQAAAAALATPFLEKAGRKIALDAENSLSSLPIMGRRKARTHSPRCGSRFEICGHRLAQVAQLLFFISTNRRMTSTRYSRC